ncbi:MAG: hypothetical protein AUG51_24965 [Acidobacteria bacterium 13_1_20CM_3_53_8]|nr:MAG: hypothetical protein AUG51_24965 [Acidobacteria bacterium 13_1_20CM_3_53_8]
MIAAHLLISIVVLALSGRVTRHLSLPASRLRLLDHPNERSLHDKPMPRTGGLAILLSFATGLIAELLLKISGISGDSNFVVSNLLIIAMLFFIAVVSLLDDWKELAPAIRLMVHIAAACGVVFGARVTIGSLALPVLGSYQLSLLAVPLTILWLVWMTNLYNFMDGMDGFAGGMSVVGFGFLCLIAWGGHYYFMALLALLAAASAGGFLIFNRPPARIFMGDVGSTFLGFLAGTLAVMGVHLELFDLWVPVLIFSPFIVDATVTLLRRLLRGEKVWQAHREHYYQRMVLAGWSHRKTVLAEYILMIGCGASAVVYMKVGATTRLVILLGCAFVYLLLAFGVRLAEQRKNLRPPELAI